MATLSLQGLEVDLDAKGSADGKIVDGAMNDFVGRHTMAAIGTGHLAPAVSMDVDLDKFWGICYLVDDESFEAEKFFKAFDFHSVMLEYENNGVIDINHYNNQCYALHCPKCRPQSCGKAKTISEYSFPEWWFIRLFGSTG